MTFSDILTAIGSYCFPIVVTIYLLWERQTYIKDQTKILQELKETIVILNENISDLKGVKYEICIFYIKFSNADDYFDYSYLWY